MFKSQLLFSVLLTIATVANAGVISLSPWSQKGIPSSGNWTLAPSGNGVIQSIQSLPTYFVSPDEFINTAFNGKLKVEQTQDDDFIGFVMGLQSPTGTGSDVDYIVFDWKQTAQSGALEGFRLASVSGTLTNPGGILFNNPLWGHLSNSDVSITPLADPVTGSEKGWLDNTTYDFDLIYQTNRIKIDISGGQFGTAGETIFDVVGTFATGKFGFYNFSQESVRYRGLTTEAAPVVVPEPSAYAMMVLGLLGMAGYGWRRRKLKAA